MRVHSWARSYNSASDSYTILPSFLILLGAMFVSIAAIRSSYAVYLHSVSINFSNFSMYSFADAISAASSSSESFEIP